jgi:glycosyltransferase involved in cell wall biosynthesis
MRVSGKKLFVDGTPLSHGGGVQVAIALLLNLQSSGQVRWNAVLPEEIRNDIPEIIAKDGRIVFVTKSTAFDKLRLFFVLSKMERSLVPDIVFTIFGPPYFIAKSFHLVGFALPNMIYEPDKELNQGFGFFDRVVDWLRCVLLRRADHLVVETETVRKRLARRLGIGDERISVIRNGVNPYLAGYRANRNEVVCGRRFGILVPSAYYRHKNLEIIPSVAASLRNIDPTFDFEFRLTLASSSEAWRNIHATSVEMAVDDRVVTLGPQRIDRLPSAYCAASAVFLPTLREASTAVYPEAFFFQRPLVTSDMDFAHELCGDAALFVPPRDPEAIARTLLQLHRSKDLAEQLVTDGLSRLEEVYLQPDAKFSMQMQLIASLAA